MIANGHSIGLDVTATGLVTVEEAEVVRRLGVRYLTGDAVALPLAAEALLGEHEAIAA